MDKILFLNEKDRNTGLSLEHSDYRYKTAKPVAATKPKHDEVGFTIPYAMFRPIREPGLLCELLGDNPVRRTADLKMNFDFLVKDLYENEISRLIYKDLRSLEKSVGDNDEESSSLDLFSLEMFENIAYIMAKHAHPDQVPDTPDEWLENFNTFSIYQILPQLIELWGLNVQTEVEARKNLAKVSG